MAIDIGQPAPAFTLKDQSGADVSLSDFAGEKAVALVFYPFTFTGVCEGELCQLRDDIADFEARTCRCWPSRATRASPRRCGPSRRATRSRCCRTSGPTVPWPRPTASSTRRSAAPTGPRS